MKKESKRHILSTVAVILAAVAAVTVLFVLHHKQQQEKARQPEESISQAEDNTIEWNGKRYTYNNNLINILFLGIDHANDIDTSYMPGDAGQADCIMLLSLDKETKEGRILQINRNTMTQIDTYDSNGSAFGTVNAQLATQYAYCIGGSRSCWATEKTVKKLLYKFFDSIFDNQNEIGVKVPLRSWKLKSDADGVVRMDEAHLISGDSFFENNELPLGTITVWEMHAPEGYLVDTVTHCIRTGTEQNGSYKALKIWNPVEIKEKLIRGDLKLVKAADKTLKRLADIPFRITSQATGESHVILTDKNGEASTGAYWNPHTVNTNEGKTSEDGIWFGEGTPDNTRGALPYGTYLVEELSCKNNEDRMLIPAFEVEVTKEMRVIDLGTLTNDEHPVPEIGTRASDRETGTHNGKRTEQVTVIDQVKWKNLEIGKEYVVKGTLMDKETKKPVLQDGKEVTAEKKLIPDTDFGEIQMEFTFDATKLKGEQVVVFEEVYLEEKLVAAHADLEDEGQSVTYKKEKQVEEEKPESPEKPKETEKAKTVATGDGSYVKILIFLIGVILTGALLLCFLLSRMCGRKWKRR